MALQYLVTSFVTSKYPWAPEPLAWTTLSGIHSLSNLANLSIKWVSYIKIGPYSPPVNEFWWSTIGAPQDVLAYDFIYYLIIFKYINLKWKNRYKKWKESDNYLNQYLII